MTNWIEPWHLETQIERRRQFGTDWRFRLDRYCDRPDFVDCQRNLFRLRGDGTAEISRVIDLSLPSRFSHAIAVYEEFAGLPFGIHTEILDHSELAEVMLKACETGLPIDPWDRRRLIYDPHDYMSAEQARNKLIM